MKETEQIKILKLKLKRLGRILLFPFRLLNVYILSQPSPYCKDKKEFAKYLKGKKVVIVGPDSGLIGLGSGNFIDSFDVVVRINHALPIPPEFKTELGERTDILYHNIWLASTKALAPEIYVPILVKSIDWLCCSYPYMHLLQDHKSDIDIYNAHIADQINFRTVDPRRYLNHVFLLRTNLNAGISAIQDLLQYDIKELFITGFSFYQSADPYHQGYRGVGNNNKVHDQKRQMAQMKRWIKSDSRIKIDETIRNILFPKAVKKVIE